jgi:LPS-assembly protein
VAASAQTYRPPIQHFPGSTTTNQEPVTGNQPVTFQSDTVTYDKEHGLVTASGHVEAWQNDHVLRADRVTFDRNTNVVAAHGHVVIVEPDGQVLFADYAELTGGMRNGVMTAMRGLMTENARMAANGARRIEGKLNVMSRGVYTTCNPCKAHPEHAPLWQLRAYQMTQDLENKRLEYTDSYLDVFGVPVLYLPYFSMSDPSVHRQSGFLIPSLGITDEYLGTFVKIPYFWVIDGQQDLTLTPEFSTIQGGQLELTYRRAFNNGTLRLDGAIASDENGLGGYVFGHGLFNWNDTWRYGFDVNLGSSVNYLRDYQVPGYGAAILSSDLFIEGFGVGSYAKLSVNTYQGLNSSINQSLLPYVLPRYEYSYFGEPDALGGRLSFDTLAYNILRDVGTNDAQWGGRLQWNRPFNGPLGQRWNATAWASGVTYTANVLNGQPNYATNDVAHGVTGQVQLALKMNWPFLRDAGRLGTQIIEPIFQVIAAPQSGNSIRDNIPNEDSLDYEFTDATLFSMNRFNGYDRYDGGVRVNVGLRGQWDFTGGEKLEGLIGASYQQHVDLNQAPQFQPMNGFDTGAHLSDVVGRASFTPDSWFDITARARVDHRNGDIHFADAIATVGHPLFTVGAGFLYGSDDPYYLYLQNFNKAANNVTSNAFYAAYVTPREEVTLNASSSFGKWTVRANARRDLESGQMVTAGGQVQWENECVIANVSAFRRFTQINFDDGDTTVLFTIVLKTIGAIGVDS